MGLGIGGGAAEPLKVPLFISFVPTPECLLILVYLAPDSRNLNLWPLTSNLRSEIKSQFISRPATSGSQDLCYTMTSHAQTPSPVTPKPLTRDSQSLPVYTFYSSLMTPDVTLT